MKKSKNSFKKCRVVLMGAAGVGKTSLISQFLGNGCPNTHEETVEEMYHSELKTPTTVYSMDILDTTGTYCFPAMKRLAINKADVFVLVFSVDSPESLQYIRPLREEILSLRGDATAKIIVVANKTDIAEVSESGSPRQHTAALVSLDWDCQFMEASAKTNVGVTDLFHTAVSLTSADRSPHLSPANSIDECSREC